MDNERENMPPAVLVQHISDEDWRKRRASRPVIATRYNDGLQPPAEMAGPDRARIAGREALVLLGGGENKAAFTRGSEWLRDLAADGQVRAWGRRQGMEDRHQEIPREFFMGKAASVHFTEGDTLENERGDVLFFDVEFSAAEVVAVRPAQEGWEAGAGARSLSPHEELPERLDGQTSRLGASLERGALPPLEATRRARQEVAAGEEPRIAVLPARKNVGGRPPKWDWAVVDREMLRLANLPDGLPARPDLMRHLLEFCEATFGEAPADSTLRAHIARIYPG